MEGKNLQDTFIVKLNKILPTLHFFKLDQSCNSEVATNADEVLKLLHDTLEETYGTKYLDDYEVYLEQHPDTPVT
jgi:hypothetical protein